LAIKEYQGDIKGLDFTFSSSFACQKVKAQAFNFWGLKDIGSKK
jgi:hypothetical protein